MARPKKSVATPKVNPTKTRNVAQSFLDEELRKQCLEQSIRLNMGKSVGQILEEAQYIYLFLKGGNVLPSVRKDDYKIHVPEMNPTTEGQPINTDMPLTDSLKWRHHPDPHVL